LEELRSKIMQLKNDLEKFKKNNTGEGWKNNTFNEVSLEYKIKTLEEEIKKDEKGLARLENLIKDDGAWKNGWKNVDFTQKSLKNSVKELKNKIEVYSKNL